MADVADGTIVDSRYRIKQRIGSGGMADVYCAEDSQLGRDVALKILHRRFARDREFVERFRREASAAAALQHPNVVSVFDRGEYDGTYYIAMEYLPGHTLKEVIRDEAPLDQQRVIGMAIQILQAAAFAHRRGVIHRDFKPHNVMVGPGDRLKVTDFGIARAGASEMTETGSIMGTAQYLSPEQAQGQRVGTASDLYSIGVVVYEMLTARVPFGGDSAVSIALKHVSEQPPPLRDLRPDVHPRLEQAVGRALLKDPAQRYASADEFIAALEQARAAIASGDNGAPGGTATWMSAPPPEEDEGLGGSRWPWIVLVLLLLGLALAAALWQPWEADRERVPNVVNLTEDRAVERLERAGFEVDTKQVESDKPVGRVVSQDPDAGQRVDEGATVELAISRGPGQQLVPSVRNLPADQARRELNDLGFRVTQDPIPSTSVREGIAVRTSPKEGTLVPKGTRVRLFISNGPPPVTVPSVIGQDKDDARQTLEGAGFEVSAQNVDSDAPEGEVVGQDPAGGTSVDKGSRVAISVSRGPREVEVPDVVGLDQGSARSALRGANLSVKTVERESDEPEGTVLSQSPSGGSSVPEGSTVTITVAIPPKDEDDGGVPPEDDLGGNGTEPNSFGSP